VLWNSSEFSSISFLSLFRILKSESFKSKCMSDDMKRGQVMDYGGEVNQLLSKNISEILKKGLAERISGIFIKPKPRVQVRKK